MLCMDGFYFAKFSINRVKSSLVPMTGFSWIQLFGHSYIWTYFLCTLVFSVLVCVSRVNHQCFCVYILKISQLELCYLSCTLQDLSNWNPVCKSCNIDRWTTWQTDKPNAISPSPTKLGEGDNKRTVQEQCHSLCLLLEHHNLNKLQETSFCHFETVPWLAIAFNAGSHENIPNKHMETWQNGYMFYVAVLKFYLIQ